MVFLFQDQNQGTRNEKARASREALASRPFSFIRTLTVGFGVAPNLLTLLRATRAGRRRSRAWISVEERPFTAGGEFRPALRTSAVRDERPETNNGERPASGQAALAWGTGMVPMPQAGYSQAISNFTLTPRRHRADSGPAQFRREKLTIATGIQIRFRFVLMVNDRP